MGDVDVDLFLVRWHFLKSVCL